MSNTQIDIHEYSESIETNHGTIEKYVVFGEHYYTLRYSTQRVITHSTAWRFYTAEIYGEYGTGECEIILGYVTNGTVTVNRPQKFLNSSTALDECWHYLKENSKRSRFIERNNDEEN